MKAKKKADPRLPKAGSVIVREYGGKKHKVTVLGDAKFRYRGQVYRSISGAARAVTGKEIISGYDFFRLSEPKARKGRKPR